MSRENPSSEELRLVKLLQEDITEAMASVSASMTSLITQHNDLLEIGLLDGTSNPISRSVMELKAILELIFKLKRDVISLLDKRAEPPVS